MFLPIIALCLSFFSIAAQEVEQKLLTVHVLLEKKQEGQDDLSWTIQSEGGFILQDPYHLECKDHMSGKKCSLTFKDGSLWVNKKKLARNRLMISPQKGNLSINDRTYAGSFSLIPEDGVWHLVNSIDVESYVCSVLRSESWPGWPVEVNKAFAIMQRSYVVAKVTQARAKKKSGKRFIYDIGCTNYDQTYQGVHAFPTLQQAVDETRGIVLAHKKKPILAMYDVCCGGLIPTKMEGVDFKGSPYLARSYPCTFCTNCKVYSWKVTYPRDYLQELCAKAGVPLEQLDELKVSKYDKAGQVREVKLRSGKKWHTVTGKQMYKICKDIKSYCFSITQHADHNKNSVVTVTGKGYGHHLGLCQWGARQMVAEGWNYKEILEFYYPHVSIMRLDS